MGGRPLQGAGRGDPGSVVRKEAQRWAEEEAGEEAQGGPPRAQALPLTPAPEPPSLYSPLSPRSQETFRVSLNGFQCRNLTLTCSPIWKISPCLGSL